MTQVSDQYPDVTEFESLLEDARMNAATDWDEQFVADLQAKFSQYGDRAFLSDSQRAQLERIANDE